MISLKRKRIDPEDAHPPNAPDSQTLKGFFSSASEETSARDSVVGVDEVVYWKAVPPESWFQCETSDCE